MTSVPEPGPCQSQSPGQSPTAQGPCPRGSKLPVPSPDLTEQQAHVSVTSGHMKLCQSSRLLPGPCVRGKDTALNSKGLAALFHGGWAPPAKRDTFVHLCAWGHASRAPG